MNELQVLAPGAQSAVEAGVRDSSLDWAYGELEPIFPELEDIECIPLDEPPENAIMTASTCDDREVAPGNPLLMMVRPVCCDGDRDRAGKDKVSETEKQDSVLAMGTWGMDDVNQTSDDDPADGEVFIDDTQSPHLIDTHEVVVSTQEIKSSTPWDAGVHLPNLKTRRSARMRNQRYSNKYPGEYF